MVIARPGIRDVLLGLLVVVRDDVQVAAEVLSFVDRNDLSSVLECEVRHRVNL